MDNMTHALNILEEEMSREARGDDVDSRPIHRLEGILTMQQRTLDQAIAHRKEFEATKNINLDAMEASFREQIDTCDRKISQIAEALTMLQKEKQGLYMAYEKRRQEILDQFKADDEALMKIIRAQRTVISALGDTDTPLGSHHGERIKDEGDGGARRPNGATRPDRRNDKKEERSQGEQGAN